MKKRLTALLMALLTLLCLLPLGALAEEGELPVATEEPGQTESPAPTDTPAPANTPIPGETESPAPSETPATPEPGATEEPAGTEEPEESQEPADTRTLEEINADIARRAREFRRQDTANGNMASDAITALFQTALKTLANKTGAKIGNWAADQFLSLIFGTSENETQKILDAIDQLSDKQDEAIYKLDEIKTMLLQQSTLDALTGLMKQSSGTLFNKTMEYLDALRLVEPGHEEQGRKDVLIWSIGNVSAGHGDMLNIANSKYDDMVKDFGNELLFEYTLLDQTKCAALNLMNKYDLQVHKWEHQGYTMREEYWNSLVNLYIASANLLQTSLMARMTQYRQDLPGGQPNILQAKLDALNAQIKKVQALAESTAVKHLSKELRHYQVPGHEAIMYATASQQEVTSLFLKANGRSDFPSTAENTVNKYWIPMYTVQSGSYKGKVGLTAQEYQNIYDDYNPKGSSAKVSMYDIFFGEDNGNITPPVGMKKDSGLLFMSSNVWTKTVTEKASIFGGKNYYYYVGVSLFKESDGSHLTWTEDSKAGKDLIGDIHTVMAYYGDGSYNWYNYLPDIYRDKLVLIVSAKADMAQGSGSHVHELQEGWKQDEQDHWLECVEGDIVALEAHSFRWVIDKQPTATTSGKKHRECQVCGYAEKAVTIAPTDKDIPKTGDESPLLLWGTLCLLSAGVLGIVWLPRRKKRRN